MEFLKATIALLEAIPVLDKWFQQLTLLYIAKQKEKENEKFLQALDKAQKEKNTEDLAASIGKHLDD